MKTQGLITFIFFWTALTSCENNDNENNANNGITFQQFDIDSNSKTTATNTFVKYDEIVGYDSIKYAFVLTEAAWKRIEEGIAPAYPDPNFGFIVALNNDLIYPVAFIAPYSSMAQFDIITLRIEDPNIVYVELGYPASTEHFTGEDLRNDLRLLKQLEKDNKIIELED